MAKPAGALCATARTSLPCRQGASEAHAGCRPDCSGLFVSGSGQMSEDILCPVRVGKLTIRGAGNWIKLNATDIAVVYHPSQHDGARSRRTVCRPGLKVTLSQK